jgi:hypothetical protein
VDRYNPDGEDHYDLANMEDRKSLQGLVDQGQFCSGSVDQCLEIHLLFPVPIDKHPIE